MVFKDNYILSLVKEDKKLELQITAKDSGHAQAQAGDISKALGAERYNLSYGSCEQNLLAQLFKDLAENNFTHGECCKWGGKFTNGVPCTYVLGSRQYIRTIILKYLDIPKDGVTAKPKCFCKQCVNPYHFTYVQGKNEKISCGDRKLVVAYRGQGVGVTQIAAALKVHRSTIYRQLSNESVSNGPENHRRGG
jgi:hypothetical protein